MIETLLATERRLVELTAGEVDAVVGGSGRPFLLQRAQEQLRQSEAARQAAILNALPAHIALLDAQGGIISVNEAWQRFGRSGGLPSPRQAEGTNYLAICDATAGPGQTDALAASAGIRAVLAGTLQDFSLEYPCHSPQAQGWFLMLVTPLHSTHAHGAIVMHLDITARKHLEQQREQARAKCAPMPCCSGNFVQHRAGGRRHVRQGASLHAGERPVDTRLSARREGNHRRLPL